MNWKPSAAVLCHLELVAPCFVDSALNRAEGRLHIDKNGHVQTGTEATFFID